MSETIEAGDVVTMNSGGPLMTVSSVKSDGTVHAYWWNGADLADDQFLAVTLKKASEPASEPEILYRPAYIV